MAPAGRMRAMSDETFLVLPRQPGREDAPSVLGCGFGSGRSGCRLSAPHPLLWEHPPAERPTLASMLLQCQPCLTPEPFRMQGKLRHGGMPPHAREGCQWAGPGHPGNLLRQGGPGLALCPARAATMGRNRPTWKALRGGSCPCFTERTQGTSPLRV